MIFTKRVINHTAKPPALLNQSGKTPPGHAAADAGPPGHTGHGPAGRRTAAGVVEPAAAPTGHAAAGAVEPAVWPLGPVIRTGPTG